MLKVWGRPNSINVQRTVFWALVRTPPEGRNQEAIASATENLRSLWDRLDQHLAGRAFVAGNAFTTGDIPVGAMYHRYHALGAERGVTENLSAWYARLAERPPDRAHVVLPLS